MKLVISILILALIIGGGVVLLRPDLLRSLPLVSTYSSSDKPGIIITTPGDVMSVLGATSQRLLNKGRNLVKRVTSEQEEALINKTVDDISRQVKDLPAEQAKKIKREFCRDVIEESQE